MVCVLVGDEDGGEGFGRDIRGQPFKRFFTTEARIDEDSRAASGDERRIAGARACQDGERNDSGDASLEDDIAACSVSRDHWPLAARSSAAAAD